jgi:hypothetical protein
MQDRYQTTYIWLQFTKLEQNLKKNTGRIESFCCVPDKQTETSEGRLNKQGMGPISSKL